jgi:hypothetical protein
MIRDFNGKPIIDFDNQIGEMIPIAAYQHPDYSGSMLTAELREPAKQRLIEWLKSDHSWPVHAEDFAEDIMTVIDLFVVETLAEKRATEEEAYLRAREEMRQEAIKKLEITVPVTGDGLIKEWHTNREEEL